MIQTPATASSSSRGDGGLHSRVHQIVGGIQARLVGRGVGNRPQPSLWVPDHLRAPGSELWFSWNARRKTDLRDALFRGAELPTGAVVVQANWRDNPWSPPS